MKWFLYYIISLTVNITSIILYRDSIYIEEISGVPIFLLLLSVFMSVYYYTNRHKEDFSTNYYGIELTDDEWERVALYTCRLNAVVIPFYIPFIIFFSPIVKAILPTLVFIISMIGGIVFYRIKYRISLRSRFDREKKELEEQKKREESGRWK